MFKKPLDLRTLASVKGKDATRKDERNYILLEDVIYRIVDEDGQGSYVVVPRGFVTDLASIPRIAWPLIGPSGAHAQAAVIHDWLYRDQSQYSRRDSDAIFLEAMRESGVNQARRWILWLGVRFPVGALVWYRNSKKSPEVIDLP